MTLRLHVTSLPAEGTVFPLPAGAARHVQVRRLQPGDALVLFDGSGAEWRAEVASIGRSEVQVVLGEAMRVDRELPLQVTLAVGVPAGERMDWLVEKATELGVARILPLLCERSVLRLAGQRAQRKREHWQAVAVAAAEQCGRTRVPAILPLLHLPDALAAIEGEQQRWLLSVSTPGQAPGPPAGSSLVVLSGPEGGLSEGEERTALAADFVPVDLGPRTLRAETAPLAVMAWLGLAR